MTKEQKRQLAKEILDSSLKHIEDLGCIVYWEDKETGNSGRIDSKIDWSIYKLDISENDLNDNS